MEAFMKRVKKLFLLAAVFTLVLITCSKKNDITDPVVTNPGTTNPPASITITSITNVQNISCSSPADCFVSGNYLYIAMKNGFEIYDISSVLSPVKIFSNYNYDEGIGIIENNDYLFISEHGSNRIIAFNASDKMNVFPIWTNFYGKYFLEIDGNYLYSMANNKITILDISVPSVTNTVTNISTIYSQYGKVKNGILAIGNSESFCLYDVSSPATGITKLGSYLFSFDEVCGVALDGTTGYAGLNSGCIYSLDISNPSSIQTNFSKDFGTSIREISVLDDYLLVSAYNSFIVVDISDPASLSVVDTITGLSVGWGMCISGNYAFVCNYNNNELKIIKLY